VFLPLWFSAYRSAALFLPAALSYKEILHRARVRYEPCIVLIVLVALSVQQLPFILHFSLNDKSAPQLAFVLHQYKL